MICCRRSHVHPTVRIGLPALMAVVTMVSLVGAVSVDTIAAVGLTERVSVSSSEGQGNNFSFKSDPDDDASIVAFDALASNLVSGDNNGASDVFVRDRTAGTTTRVSVSSTGAQGNGSSITPVVTGDGALVAFASSAPNLVAGDTNSFFDVFLHDRTTAQTTRLSVGPGGAQGDADSFSPSISPDGRFVSFTYDASTLVPGDTPNTRDVFLLDRQTGVIEQIHVSSSEVPGNSSAAASSVSADGRFVAYSSFANNLVPNDTNDAFDVFVRDRQAGTTVRVSVSSAGMQANAPSSGTKISANGQFVAFFSEASNLVTGDTNGVRDFFVHDLQTHVTERVNVSSDEAQANTQSGFSIRGGSTDPDLSADGRFVSFDSSANNLVPNDTNGVQDVFVRDRQTGTTERRSVDSAGNQGNDGSTDTAMTADGSFVTFVSAASNLVTGDTNACVFPGVGHCPDVFVQGQGTPPPQSCTGTGSFRISGTITTSSGVLSGVTLSLSGPNGCTAATSTNSRGVYRFLSLGPGTYTITPSKPGCTFSPPSGSATITTRNVRVNFTATCS